MKTKTRVKDHFLALVSFLTLPKPKSHSSVFLCLVSRLLSPHEPLCLSSVSNRVIAQKFGNFALVVIFSGGKFQKYMYALVGQEIYQKSSPKATSFQSGYFPTARATRQNRKNNEVHHILASLRKWILSFRHA